MEIHKYVFKNVCVHFHLKTYFDVTFKLNELLVICSGAIPGSNVYGGLARNKS